MPFPLGYYLNPKMMFGILNLVLLGIGFNPLFKFEGVSIIFRIWGNNSVFKVFFHYTSGMSV